MGKPHSCGARFHAQPLKLSSATRNHPVPQCIAQPDQRYEGGDAYGPPRLLSRTGTCKRLGKHVKAASVNLSVTFPAFRLFSKWKPMPICREDTRIELSNEVSGRTNEQKRLPKEADGAVRVYKSMIMSELRSARINWKLMSQNGCGAHYWMENTGCR